MTETPILFDPACVEQHRIRARRAPSGPALFLHEAVRAEIEDRLNEVNKTFTDPVIVTGWPEVWSDMPEMRIISDTEALDLQPASCDLIIHALSLHWSNDPVGQLVQCQRALRPDGLLLAAFFGGRTLWELRAALTEAEAALTGGLSPRVSPMAELREAGGLLQRAGYALPVADQFPLNVTYASPFALMHDLRAMGETNATTGRLRRPTRRAVMFDAVRRYADEHGTPDGRIPATFEVLLLTGWAPDTSQQKPLRPGSAAQRLADALGTIEHSTK